MAWRSTVNMPLPEPMLTLSTNSLMRQYAPMFDQFNLFLQTTPVNIDIWCDLQISSINFITWFYKTVSAGMKFAEQSFAFPSINSNIYVKPLIYGAPNPKHECVSSRLAVVFAQTAEARCSVGNEDLVGAAPTGDAPATSEWSTSLYFCKFDWTAYYCV